MKIFIAGATGVIGRPLVAELIRQGHTVTALSRSEGSSQRLAALGAGTAVANVFDGKELEEALRQSEAEMVIDQLTSLPKDPAQFSTAFPIDRRLRLEGGGNLHRAAQAAGVHRYLQQSSGYFLKGNGALADESCPLLSYASPGILPSAQMYAEIESRLLHSGSMEGVALRYGIFYGPGTWYHPDGAMAETVRKQQFPVVGNGKSVWSFIHVEDAARATVAALTGPPGIYNIVDSDPSPVSQWLPGFAQSVGAPPPPHVTEAQALAAAGEDAVYYGTKLCGASNEKARTILQLKPRRLEWLEMKIS
jgi:nucleoside-diphosphate-sugar epimerase